MISSIATYKVGKEAERKRREEARKRAEELMHLRNKLTKNGKDWYGLSIDKMKQKANQIDANNKAYDDYVMASVISVGGDPNMSIETARAIHQNATIRKNKETTYKNSLKDSYDGFFTDNEIEEYATALSYGEITFDDISSDANLKIIDLNKVAYADSLKNAYGNQLSDEEIYDIADDLANGRKSLNQVNDEIKAEKMTYYDVEKIVNLQAILERQNNNIENKNNKKKGNLFLVLLEIFLLKFLKFYLIKIYMT